MRRFPYCKINAFTSGGSLGNPAAFVRLGSASLADAEMLRIAREHQGFVSEVVFCQDTPGAACRLTYFSSECEVAFCGHGTIATMYEVIRSDESLLGRQEVIIETRRKGRLVVHNRLPSEDAIYITAPPASGFAVPVSHEELAVALKAAGGAVSRDMPLDLIDAGLRTLIVPISTLDHELALHPDQERLRRFCLAHDIDIILTFCLEVAQPDAIAHSRVFAPKFGYLEDPATGSGNSAFGHYLTKQGLWDGSRVGIEQGGAGPVFNKVRLMRSGPDLLFGGSATKRIEGMILVD